MAYRALYRVFRPQTFQDVVGQEHITKTLQNALREQRFSHAYLFSGPRGTGKTSAAKILAKAVNCQQGPAPEPCNECAACKGITEGSVVDVIEIDAASNRGVEEIRDVRDKVKYAPSEVRFKVYIIDEVHMLTTEAFNALLKTLEEPPGHVIFILATTEPHRLPATIISRCQRFDFRSISAKAMMDRLRYIAATENVEISDQALALMSRVSEGGMRDVLSLFDQVLSYSGNKVEVDDVILVTGVVSQSVLAEVTELVRQKNASGLLEVLQRVISEGKNSEQFLNDLLMYFRDLLLYKTAPKLDELQHRLMGDDQFHGLSQSFTHPFLYSIIEKLSKVSQDMKWASHPKIVLEMGLIRLLESEGNSEQPKEAATNASVEDLLQRINQLEQRLNQVGQVAVSTPAAEVMETPRKEAMRRVGMPSTVRISENRIREVAAGSEPEGLRKITGLWSDVLNRIKKKKIQVHAWLLDGVPVAVGSGGLVVSFKSAIHRETTEKPQHRQIIEEVLQSVWGQRLDLLTLMENQWQEIEATTRSTGASEPQGEENKEESDPFLDEAIKLVGEHLIHIKD
ncbi:DNA polymerase III subunit gamma/tau [Ammoniphilus sp. CFH 90114]|uniref:DNA polymerase III subunit gamma/tau n=1 Tax=Ammoniphilus sp. CFH 90114 TaxID=2493665 RepID=UPI00100EAAFA|nr:DNA polymerase III subunit gamma/tau [Ammoniphilus sp. CFH 90114]RXT08975.1 DNA polymerase III subunit gamma/tau [Ammoniphilus sp. CFH 90114]